MRLAAALLLLFGGPAFADTSPKPSPQGGPPTWKGFKAGAFAKYTMKYKMGGMVLDIEMKQTLVEVKGDRVVVDMTTKFQGNEHTQRQESGLEPEQFKPVEGSKKSRETVKVGEKKFACEVADYEYDQMGQKTKMKLWTSREIPGGVVKWEMEMPGGQGSATMELTEFGK